MRSATAIGLAIHADTGSGYQVDEIFNRNFGVWRETDSGQRVTFDAIFPKGTRLPGAGDPPLHVKRTYYPVHNIGHFRYLEANELDGADQPVGDLTMWDEIFFPFDPKLLDGTEAANGMKHSAVAADAPLKKVAVNRLPSLADQLIEEEYRCDAAGVVTVTLRNLTAHYTRSYKLAGWSGKPAAAPGKAKKGARAQKAS
jgi:hypothetical protein